MKDNNRILSIAIALVLAGNASALPAAAQDRPAVMPPQKQIQLPCCRCLDGKSTSVDVSTAPITGTSPKPGTAPWSVAFGNSAAQPVASASNVSWTPVSPGKWVGPSGPASVGDYTFQMPFQIPNCVIPMQVTISGKFAADNTGKLYIDGNLVKASQGTPNYGFLPGSVTPFTWSGSLAPGPHSIKVVVTNTSGPTGLVVAATITVTCPRQQLDHGNVGDAEFGPPRTDRTDIDLRPRP